ncbi:MAG: hypothetical protein ACR2IR_10435 [Acidimicrobiia bacterium]
MLSKCKRVLGAITAVAALAAGLGMLAVPAGARGEAKNDKFCEVLSSDQGAGVDFEGLGPAEAEYAATLNRKLAKTGVPAKLKKDLKKLEIRHPSKTGMGGPPRRPRCVGAYCAADRPGRGRR